MGHGAEPAPLQRQPRLRAVERLDLALLVDREDDGVGRRIDIEADDIPELVGELRVVRQLEGPDAVRRELVGIEDALDRAQANIGRPGEHPSCPVGRLVRRVALGQAHHFGDPTRPNRGAAGRPRLVT